jgi:hypothetical protein
MWFVPLIKLNFLLVYYETDQLSRSEPHADSFVWQGLPRNDLNLGIFETSSIRLAATIQLDRPI